MNKQPKNPLDNTYLKLERAKEHLEALETEVRRFQQTHLVTILPEKDFQGPWTPPRIEISQESFPHFGLLAGDAVHNMRASLDALVWQLSSLNPKVTDPGRDTEFPIFKDKPTKPRDIERYNRKVKHVPSLAKDIIEELQPYHRGQASEKHMLSVLHFLDIIDKHRIVPVIGYAEVFRPSGPQGPYLRVMGRALQSIDIHFPAAGDGGQLDPQLSIDIVFDMAGPAYNTPVLQLYHIHEFISKDVIPRFTQFFS